MGVLDGLKTVLLCQIGLSINRHIRNTEGEVQGPQYSLGYIYLTSKYIR